MKAIRERSTLMALLTSLAAVSLAWAGDPHEHGEDGVVGVNSSGQLALEFAEGTTFELPPVSDLINGWALDDPGFMSLGEDEPDEDFYVLNPGALIGLEVISFVPALKVYTPGFIDTLNLPGERWEIGSPPFDEHPTWHIDSNDPLFDPEMNMWSGTFRMLDLGSTGYAPSEPFTLTFLPVPEPGTLGLFGGISLCLLGYRRQRHCCR